MEKKHSGNATTCEAPVGGTSKKNEGCCTCEADLKREVDHLVQEVEGYTKSDHDKKRRELNDTFKK